MPIAILLPFALSIASIVPVESAVTESVDLVELNHFYDFDGKHVFDQTIFYDWSQRHSRFMVVAWRLVKSPAQLPVRDWQHGGYRCLWHDPDDAGMLREVRAVDCKESWTQYDPELIEREYLPKEERRDLRKPDVVPPVEVYYPPEPPPEPPRPVPLAP